MKISVRKFTAEILKRPVHLQKEFPVQIQKSILIFCRAILNIMQITGQKPKPSFLMLKVFPQISGRPFFTMGWCSGISEKSDRPKAVFHAARKSLLIPGTIFLMTLHWTLLVLHIFPRFAKLFLWEEDDK